MTMMKMRSRRESLDSCPSVRALYAMRIRILLQVLEARRRCLRQRQEEELLAVHRRTSRIRTKRFRVAAYTALCALRNASRPRKAKGGHACDVESWSKSANPG